MTWEHGFVIETDDTIWKKPSCKDCSYYVKEDKTCGKTLDRIVDIGWKSWRTCKYFNLYKSVPNYSEKKKYCQKNGKKFKTY